MPRRRQRKPKVHKVMNLDSFLEALDTAFDFDTPEEIFNEIRQDSEITSNFVKFYSNFVERVIVGNTGLIVQQGSFNDSDFKCSILGCDSSVLDSWLRYFDLFTREHPFFRNKMDEILSLVLSRVNYMDPVIKKYVDEKRIYIIIASMFKYRIYQRSKAHDFFLQSCMAGANSEQLVANVLNGFKDVDFDLKELFDILCRYGFIDFILKDGQIPDSFWEEKCPFFLDQLNDYRKNIEKHQQQRQIQSDIRDSKQAEAFELFGQSCTSLGLEDKSVIDYGFSLCLSLIEINSRSNQQNEVMLQFQQCIPFIKLVIKPTVINQGIMMDILQKTCFQKPHLSEGFKPILMILYKEQLIDGKVILAWHDRAVGLGKAAFGCQINRFVEWLKGK